MKNLKWGLGFIAVTAIVAGCSDPSADLQRRIASRPKAAAVRTVNFTSQEADMFVKKVSRYSKLPSGEICKYQTIGGGKNDLSITLGGKELFSETVDIAGLTGCSIVLYDTKGKPEHLIVTDEVRNSPKTTSSFRVVVVGNPGASVDVKLGGAPFVSGLKSPAASESKDVQGTPAEAEITGGSATEKVKVPLKNGDGCTVFVYVKDDGKLQVISTTNAPDREPIKAAPSAAG